MILKGFFVHWKTSGKVLCRKKNIFRVQLPRTQREVPFLQPIKCARLSESPQKVHFASCSNLEYLVIDFFCRSFAGNRLISLFRLSFPILSLPLSFFVSFSFSPLCEEQGGVTESRFQTRKRKPNWTMLYFPLFCGGFDKVTLCEGELSHTHTRFPRQMSGENEENINKSLPPLVLCPKKHQHGRNEKIVGIFNNAISRFFFLFRAHTLLNSRDPTIRAQGGKGKWTCRN